MPKFGIAVHAIEQILVVAFEPTAMAIEGCTDHFSLN